LHVLRKRIECCPHVIKCPFQVGRPVQVRRAVVKFTLALSYPPRSPPGIVWHVYRSPVTYDRSRRCHLAWKPSTRAVESSCRAVSARKDLLPLDPYGRPTTLSRFGIVINGTHMLLEQYLQPRHGPHGGFTAIVCLPSSLQYSRRVSEVVADAAALIFSVDNA
jgi:hypothetical protein